MSTTGTAQPFSRTDRSRLGAWWWTVDRAMLSAVFFLALFGLAMISTASPPVAQDLGYHDYHFLFKQVIFLVPALLLMVGISMLNPRTIWRLGSIMLLGCIAALILTLFIGIEIKGARRWLPLLGVSLQPSEFIKPAFAVVAAWLIALNKSEWRKVGGHKKPEQQTARRWFTASKDDFSGYYLVMAIYGLIVMLLMMQPDLGMSVVVTCVFATQIFLAGLRLRYLALLMLIGPMLLASAYASHPHVKSRIDRFFYPESGDTYQVDKSLEAFKTGGITGAGPGQGSVKMHLPDAHADFIFSVTGEEFGLFFVLGLIGAFLFIMMRGMKRLIDNGDMFQVLAVGGLLTMFGLQAFIHMGSSVNILPAKGMTMPFISYGGSSVISLGISMGIILALTRKQRRSALNMNTLLRTKFTKNTPEQGAAGEGNGQY